MPNMTQVQRDCPCRIREVSFNMQGFWIDFLFISGRVAHKDQAYNKCSSNTMGNEREKGNKKVAVPNARISTECVSATMLLHTARIYRI